MKLGRREFLGQVGRLPPRRGGRACVYSPLQSGGLSKTVPSKPAGAAGGPGFGLLRRDPENILDLPKGFSYRIISKAGQRMKDGFVVPSLPDGMAAFPGPDGSTLILRNHEFRFGHPATLGPFGGKKNLWKKLDKSLI